jgi:tetratricopeptide (TPR) repeat protein
MLHAMKQASFLLGATSLLLLAAATGALAASGPAKSTGPALGQLDFPVTGSPECQRLFRQGMLEMHSFQYDQAHASFGAALKADAGCAMAAWGDAMAYTHPVWAERDLAKAKAALALIVPEREDALTPRERAHIAVARALYDAADAKAGLSAWLAAVARMRAEYPDDDEVALQHALALIAVHGYDKTRQREQSEAGALALDVLSRRPDHPGAAHYIIHAFDNPEHAILALPAARTYSRIAPAAAHAVHMPSHTFTHLGMWRDVVPSNVRAYASSQAAARALGQSPDKWDWHSYSWLVAAHLELGQPARARKLVDDARALLATDDSAELRFGYADIARNYLAQTGRWAEAEALAAPLLTPIRSEGTGADGPLACAEHAPGGGGEERPPFVYIARIAAHGMRAEAALRTGDAAAEARGKDIAAVVEQMKPWAKTGRMNRQATISTAYVAEIRARAGLLRARTPETEKQALDAIARSVQLAEPIPIAGPAHFLTARERLAEALLAAGKPAEALAEYERVVEARPNRALSLLGAARAARASGDTAKERAHYRALADLWTDADADLPVLAEVRAGAGGERRAAAP